MQAAAFPAEDQQRISEVDEANDAAEQHDKSWWQERDQEHQRCEPEVADDVDAGERQQLSSASVDNSGAEQPFADGLPLSEQQGAVHQQECDHSQSALQHLCAEADRDVGVEQWRESERCADCETDDAHQDTINKCAQQSLAAAGENRLSIRGLKRRRFDALGDFEWVVGHKSVFRWRGQFCSAWSSGSAADYSLRRFSLRSSVERSMPSIWAAFDLLLPVCSRVFRM